MLRRINPRKNQQKKKNEMDGIPLKAKRKEQKQKYRNWLDEEDDFDIEEDLYGTDDELDFEFDDELDIPEDFDFNHDFDSTDDNEDDY
ncbi:MAG: hypothetical protein AB8H03_04655 [Saprospiraceae bacterium]